MLFDLHSVDIVHGQNETEQECPDFMVTIVTVANMAGNQLNLEPHR